MRVISTTRHSWRRSGELRLRKHLILGVHQFGVLFDAASRRPRR